jgi:ferric-dicitrate binding protein FerR (iron transport regulator)
VPAKKPSAPTGTTLNNCHITTNTAANEHTRAAVEALAAASEAHARALEAAARALTQQGNAYGVYLEAPTN